MSQFRPAKRRAEVSVGESVRIVRELQGLSQNDLAQLSGIAQARPSRTIAFALVSNGPRFLRKRCVVILPSWYFPAGSCPLKQRPNPSLNADVPQAGLRPPQRAAG
jgi:hypothetical protein